MIYPRSPLGSPHEKNNQRPKSQLTRPKQNLINVKTFMGVEIYKKIVSPGLDQLERVVPSDTLQAGAKNLLYLAENFPWLVEKFAYGRRRFVDNRLRTQLGSLDLDNPLMVGAGWTKDGKSVMGLWLLGYSGVVVGGVTLYPQSGNPKFSKDLFPQRRQATVAPGVYWNWRGYDNPGAEKVSKIIAKDQRKGPVIILSVAPNKDTPRAQIPERCAEVIRIVGKRAHVAAVEMGFSPNTEGLEELKRDLVLVGDTIQACKQVMRELGIEDFILKNGPDEDDQTTYNLARVVIDNGGTGMAGTNTTVDPEVKARYGERWRHTRGGFSGDDPVFRRKAIRKVAFLFVEFGNQIEIVGVGGTKDVPTLVEKNLAGAKGHQVVSGNRSEGPSLPGRTLRGVVKWMEEQGIESLEQSRGQEARRFLEPDTERTIFVAPKKT